MLFLLLGLSLLCQTTFATRTLAPVGINGGQVNYYSYPLYANALSQGQWLSVECGQYCWSSYTYGPLPSPQFINGIPQFLTPEQDLIRGIVYSLHDTHQSISLGLWNVSWIGTADIRLDFNPEFLPGLSSGPSTGLVTDGYRVYNCTTMGGGDIEVLAIDNSTGPMKSIKVMQPDPANPYHASLPENTLFHPTYLQRVKERNWQYFRTMDMTETNDNPQQDWFDRRLPSNVMQTGVINPRSPAPNYEWAGYNHTTGSAYEFLVMLANDLGLDMWLNIPHLATDDFITQLAQLVLYGSDGVNPYTSPQQHPAYPPLRSDLKLYLEYSNGSFLIFLSPFKVLTDLIFFFCRNLVWWS